MSIQVSVLVANVDVLIANGYTRIEVYCSEDSGSTYVEMTSSVAAAAYLESEEASTTFRMGGKELRFKLDDGSEQTVTFSSLVDNWTPAQVATRINEVTPGIATVVGSLVKLTSATTGRSSRVYITYNDATDLGWAAGDENRGTIVRPTLTGGLRYYTVTDIAGTSTNRYKWRFSADGSAPISEYSSVVYGSTAPLISSSLLASCYGTITDVTGRPLQTKIIIGQVTTPFSVGGYIVGNDSPIVITTGEDGYFQTSLVKGAVIRVAIEGTTMVREFTVPNADFDLLEALSDATDPFTIATVTPRLTRRTV